MYISQSEHPAQSFCCRNRWTKQNQVLLSATLFNSCATCFPMAPQNFTKTKLQERWHCVTKPSLRYNCKDFYYMARSASGQDGTDPALLLATRVGKTELSCLLGTIHLVRKQNVPKVHIIFINPFLTRLFRSRWLDIGLVHFLTPSRSIN